MRKTLTGILFTLGVTTGCAHMSSVEKFSDKGPMQLVCDGKDECEAAWGRALIWVTENCPYAIQTQTDSLITTAGPAAYRPELACRVTRAPMGKGKARLLFGAACGNILACQPSPEEAHASFYAFVNEGMEVVRSDAMADAQREADKADATAAQDRQRDSEEQDADDYRAAQREPEAAAPAKPKAAPVARAAR